MGIRSTTPADRDYDKALDIFDRVTEKAGPGEHRLVLCVSNGHAAALSSFPFKRDGEDMEACISNAYEFTDLLAVAVSAAHSAGMTLRTTGDPDTACGWQFDDEGDPLPLTSAEAFSAYATTPFTGEPQVPMPGTEYIDAPVIHI
ncbi:hypothetical protein [Streptomyces californicus]